ncbi:TPA: hypothetical protein DIC40_04935 [Patescibacteria group bacterium]|nr:hypothetical protein P148_SR1C00001G0586 [candidate division SR1 bacterium RAAC1_SR1_1]HCY21164.1 hypothetical protein [Candidatus Gracilibacteria bacterium]
MDQETKKLKKILGIPGCSLNIRTQISEEESKKRIEEMHDELFSPFRITEGSRHGNRSFPMDIYDLDDIQRS